MDRPAPPQAPVRAAPTRLRGRSSLRQSSLASAGRWQRPRSTLSSSRIRTISHGRSTCAAAMWLTRPCLSAMRSSRTKGGASLFFDPVKITNEAGDAVGELAEFAPDQHLSERRSMSWARKAERSASIPATGAVAIMRRHRSGRRHVDVGADPIALMKAVKNDAEIAGSRAAHLRDGAAIARYPRMARSRGAHRPADRDRRGREASKRFRVETGALKNVSFPSDFGRRSQRRPARIIG